MFCAPLPPKYDDAVVGGSNLAARLIGAPSEHDTSLGEVKLDVKEEKDNEDKDEEGMERRQGLL